MLKNIFLIIVVFCSFSIANAQPPSAFDCWSIGDGLPNIKLKKERFDKSQGYQYFHSAEIDGRFQVSAIEESQGYVRSLRINILRDDGNWQMVALSNNESDSEFTLSARPIPYAGVIVVYCTKI